MRIVKPTLLLTGAAGVLGRALIDELSPDFTIVALRHRTRLADPRVREFAGSLNDPTLGLSERDYARLADSVDVVLHGAAATSWKADPRVDPRDEHRRHPHDAGLRRAGRGTDVLRQHRFRGQPAERRGRTVRRRRAYIASKVEAEQLTPRQRRGDRRSSGRRSSSATPATAGWPPSRDCTGSPG